MDKKTESSVLKFRDLSGFEIGALRGASLYPWDYKGKIRLAKEPDPAKPSAQPLGPKGFVHTVVMTVWKFNMEAFLERRGLRSSTGWTAVRWERHNGGAALTVAVWHGKRSRLYEFFVNDEELGELLVPEKGRWRVCAEPLVVAIWGDAAALDWAVRTTMEMKGRTADDGPFVRITCEHDVGTMVGALPSGRSRAVEAILASLRSLGTDEALFYVTES